MANIMNMTGIRNKVSRSGFDLSRRNCFTASVGEILPVYNAEVLPGDKWSINVREFMRTAPVQTATFGRLRQYYDFYFVPYSLLWDKFESWIVQTKNAYHAKDNLTGATFSDDGPYFSYNDIADCLTNGLRAVVSEEAENVNLGNKYKDYHPSFHSQSGNFDGYDQVWMQSWRLLTYLGYPFKVIGQGTDRRIAKWNGTATGNDDLKINPFPILAYQKIYQDWFRFSQWEDAAPWTCNLDYMFSSGTKIECLNQWNSTATAEARQKPTPFTLRYCNLDKDYYNGILPAPQFGDTAVATPLSGSVSRIGFPSFGNSRMDFLPADSANQDDMIAPLQFHTDVNGKSVTWYDLDNHAGGTASKRAVLENVSGYLNLNSFDSTLGLSILVLRQAEALQKWREVTLSGSSDYKEQLSKHWNVDVSDDSSYRCKYLGGIANNIDVSEVLNTNLEAADSEAEIHGKGISASNGHISFDSHQYGIIMCVYHCKPLIEWNAYDVMPKMLYKTHATDYAIPEFDRVGMEAVLVGEFDATAGLQDKTKVAGYAPRYIDYKTSYDVVNGEFQTNLSPWVIPHGLPRENPEDGSVLSKVTTFRDFKVAPWICDDLFGVMASLANQFRNTVYFDCKVVRNLDANGLPY